MRTGSSRSCRACWVAVSVVIALYLYNAGPAGADELVTVSGDRLTGKILEVGCDGVSFEYRYGQRLFIGLGAVETAQSSGSVPLMLRGGDRLSGLISVQSGSVQLASAALGAVILQPRSLAPTTMVGSRSPTSCGAGLDPVPGAQARRVVGAGSKLAAPANSAVAEADEPRVAQLEQNASGQAAPQPGGPPITSDNAEEETTEFLQFLRSQAVLLQPRKVEADVAVAYLRTKQSIQDDKEFVLTATGRVGIISGLEGFVQVPLSWAERKTLLFTGEVKNTNQGVGDVSFGLKYSVIPESLGVPNIVADLSAAAPTGGNPYERPTPGEAVRDTRDLFSPALGTGHWSVTGGVTAIKTFDPLVFFAGVDYTHWFEEQYYGVRVQPGDMYGLTSGVGFAASETDTLSAQVFADFQQNWSFDGNSSSESETSPISLRLSYTHILSERDLVEPSVLFGLTRDARDAAIAISYSRLF